MAEAAFPRFNEPALDSLVAERLLAMARKVGAMLSVVEEEVRTSLWVTHHLCAYEEMAGPARAVAHVAFDCGDVEERPRPPTRDAPPAEEDEGETVAALRQSPRIPREAERRPRRWAPREAGDHPRVNDDIICHRCGREGHIARECRSRMSAPGTTTRGCQPRPPAATQPEIVASISARDTDWPTVSLDSDLGLNMREWRERQQADAFLAPFRRLAETARADDLPTSGKFFLMWEGLLMRWDATVNHKVLVVPSSLRAGDWPVAFRHSLKYLRKAREAASAASASAQAANVRLQAKPPVADPFAVGDLAWLHCLQVVCSPFEAQTLRRGRAAPNSIITFTTFIVSSAGWEEVVTLTAYYATN
ncbi:unnamed protein product [Lampetra planeri]